MPLTKTLVAIVAQKKRAQPAPTHDLEKRQGGEGLGSVRFPASWAPHHTLQRKEAAALFFFSDDFPI